MAMTRKFFHVKFVPMFSLGSFRVKDARDVLPDSWWYEFTFLFFEFVWGQIYMTDEQKSR
jgi:hypothetical protein